MLEGNSITEIKIEDCQRRKRIYTRLIKKIEKGVNFGLYKDEMDAIQLAIVRSVAIEHMNIKDLKEKAENE